VDVFVIGKAFPDSHIEGHDRRIRSIEELSEPSREAFVLESFGERLREEGERRLSPSEDAPAGVCQLLVQQIPLADRHLAS
jgi:hypothetical protein